MRTYPSSLEKDDNAFRINESAYQDLSTDVRCQIDVVLIILLATLVLVDCGDHTYSFVQNVSILIGPWYPWIQSLYFYIEHPIDHHRVVSFSSPCRSLGELW